MDDNQCCAWVPEDEEFPYHPSGKPRIKCTRQKADESLCFCSEHLEHMNKIRDRGHDYFGLYARFTKDIRL